MQYQDDNLLDAYLNEVYESSSTEVEVIGAIVRILLINKDRVTKQDILIILSGKIKTSSNSIHKDILRRCFDILEGNASELTLNILD